jgi:type 2 lantibiotic biosynthesis protein LanM
MQDTILSRSAWYLAYTLSERAKAGKANQAQGQGRGKKRFRRWRELHGFEEDSFFQQRLAAEGLTEESFLALLVEDSDAVRQRFESAPAWLRNWAEACGAPAELPVMPSSDQWREHPGMAFLPAVAPLLRLAAQKIAENVQEVVASGRELPFDPERIVALLLTRVPAELAGMMSRTMVLELNVARVRGELTGDTPEARFESFIDKLADPEFAQRIISEYPVLARSLAQSVERQVAVGRELIERLARDWQEICGQFCDGKSPGRLTDLSFGMGDTHCGGRSVAVLTFRDAETNGEFKLVYKPRCLSVERHFQELLGWFNQRGKQTVWAEEEGPFFHLMRVMDRGDYGWVEFIRAGPCQSIEEVRRFYRRQGAYLALLYGLEATDFHYENLIAAGEHPVLIDLESIFHARENTDETFDDQPLAAARKAVGDSVLRIGLLPVRLWGDGNVEGVDLSGLGAAEGQISPIPAPYWDRGRTDEMGLKRMRLPIPGQQNRPMLSGQPLNAMDYAAEIEAGFTKMYRLLLCHREELIDGPLANFARDETRCILRPTMTYSWLLNESLHPDWLQDALDRDLFFERLWHAARQRPEFFKIVPMELRDLCEGDVPLFTCRPGSRDLKSSRGEVIEGFFEKSGLELVADKLRSLKAGDCERQRWFIRASLSALADDSASSVPEQAIPAEAAIAGNRTLPMKDALLDLARGIGDRLEQMAYRKKSEAVWLGLTVHPERSLEKHWTIAPIGADLYDGLPGIALFLAHLGHITGEGRYTDLARAALASTRNQIAQGNGSFASIGAFSGLGGILYAYTHLAELLDQPSLLDEADSLLEKIPPLLAKDSMFDIIGGAAGCMLTLLGLHRRHADRASADRAMTLAVECGEHLLANRKQMDRGAAWPVEEFGPAPLMGFSHGASGIAYALMELSAVAAEPRFRQAALEALEYERGLYAPTHANWPDLREVKNPYGSPAPSKSEPRFLWAWCHGAPGAALARLRMLPWHRDEFLAAETIAATHGAFHFSQGGNHSLCHGALGNLETLLQARAAFPDGPWAGLIEHAASAIVAGIQMAGPVCGNPMKVESPGLMTGLAGIGYQLLRLREPEAVPSVLSLETSAAAAGARAANFAVAD